MILNGKTYLFKKEYAAGIADDSGQKQTDHPTKPSGVACT